MSRDLKLTAAYDASLLAPPSEEMAPVLAVWSSFNSAKSLRFYPLKMQERSFLSEKFDISVPLPPVGEERRDDAVWFEVYAMSPNKHGSFVRNRVGCAFVYVNELKPHKEVSIDLCYFNFWDKTGERRVKGRLGMVAKPFENTGYNIMRDDDLGTTPFDFVPAQNAFLQSEMAELIRRSIWPYTEDAQAKGQAILPLDKKNERVHAPAWNGPSGWKPGYTYFVTPGARGPPPGDAQAEAHLEDVLLKTLMRHDMPAELFSEIISNQTQKQGDEYDDRFTECCDIVAEACCAPATSCPYIGDAVNTHNRIAGNGRGLINLIGARGKHGVESFDWVQLRSGGDCEDLARMIHAYRCAIQDGEWNSPVLRSAQELLHCYIGVGILSSVLGAQLSDGKDHSEPFVLGTARDNNVSIGAHMYYQLIPEHKMLTMIRRVNRNLDVDELRSPHAPAAAWREKLPHMVLEGTGMLQALQRPLVSYVTDPDPAAKRAVLERENNLQRANAFLGTRVTARFRGNLVSIMACSQTVKRQKQTERLPNARINTFYRDATHAFTDDFLKRGFRVAEFTWVSVGEPDLVPGDADDLYADDPMLERTAEPAAGAQANDQTEWEQFHSGFTFDSDSEPEGVAAPAVVENTVSFTDSHWRRPAAGAHLFAAAPAAGQIANNRFDRFDYTATERKEIRYGIPLTTSLEDRPMRNHVALLAGPPIDEVAAGALATHYRHSKPIPRAGDLRDALAVTAAQRESLVAAGVDIERMEDDEEQNLAEFERKFAQLEQDEWPGAYDQLVKQNIFISSEHFRMKEMPQFVLDALVPHIGSQKAIPHARIWRESFLPGRTNLVVQMLFDPELL